MKKLTLVLLLSCNVLLAKSDSINLAGQWFYELDRNNVGMAEKWFSQQFDKNLELPGSLQAQGIGDAPSLNTPWIGDLRQAEYDKEKYAPYKSDENFKFPFWLTPEKHYRGVAWYQKKVTIPAEWQDKYIELSLERCHWETRVFVDDQYIGADSSLCTPHRYDLSEVLTPGDHTITIRVNNDMIINVGPNSHSVSDHTQSNWNGIVGDISLTAKDKVFIENLELYPDVDEKLVQVKIFVKNLTGTAKSIKISAKATLPKNKPLKTVNQTTKVDKAGVIELDYQMGENPMLWDEFEQNLYKMIVTLEAGAIHDEKTTMFGMRDISTLDTRIHVNGRPVFLRGTLECAIFPKTGYPPTDVAEWERIYKKIKSFGLNHMRFHSWCPPKAAFIAADQVGVYLQVEGPSWANQGSSLGDGLPIDQYNYSEAERVFAEYGNHPSFCMYAYGNEPAGDNQQKYLGNFINYFRDKDKRRLYTSAAGWPIIEESDYHSDPNPRIQRWGEGLSSIINAQPPNTVYHFGDIISPYNKPLVSHEIGQWCVYPNFDEIEKYDGVLKAKNFEIYKDFLEKNGMGHQAHDFLMASGKLQTLCYKADIEAALRTPGFAGFQLLDLHDFPGQGTALVGVLDPFWDEKGYITADEYSRFCNTTVPLALLEKRAWTNDEFFNVEIELAHFGKQMLSNKTVYAKIVDEKSTLFSTEIDVEKVSLDNCQKIGSVSFPLKDFKAPQKLTLKIAVDDIAENSWNFWVYPKNQTVDGADIIITDELSNSIKNKLENGATVLLTLNGKIKPEMGGEVAVGFSPAFWNTAWTDNQPPHTLGILCDPKHPLFEKFPTEYHTNWQWWDVLQNAQAINLTQIEPNFTPSIQLIDTWFEARKLALLLETKVGKGKLVVTSIDFSDLESRPASHQLYISLTNYMNSEKFDPEHNMTLKEILKLYE